MIHFIIYLGFMNDFSKMGHHVDELLVGIVMLIRLRETETEPNIRQKHSLAQKIFQGFISLVKGKEDKNRLACKNLNIL